MKKFTDIRVLTTSAMLLAVAAVFGFFKIPVSNIIEIRLQFLPVACAGYLFGMPAGAIVGGLSDILCYIVKPTGPFFPGFTINSIIEGLVFGFFLYKKPVTLKRVSLAVLVNTVVVDLCLTPLWLMMLYKNAFSVIFTTRIIKVIVMYPINIALLMGILKPVTLVSKRMFEQT